MCTVGLHNKKYNRENVISEKVVPSESYDTYASVYDLFYNSHVDTEYLDKIWKPSWIRVLEVGVGTGRLMPYYKKKSLVKYVGLDISEITHLLKCKDTYHTDNKKETRYLKYLRMEFDEVAEELNWISNRRYYPLLDLLTIAESVGLSIVSYNIYGDDNNFFGSYEGYFVIFERKPFYPRC